MLINTVCIIDQFYHKRDSTDANFNYKKNNLDKNIQELSKSYLSTKENKLLEQNLKKSLLVEVRLK